jgi:nicotinamidase-related amidase
MKPHIWDKFLTDRDKAVFSAGGFGARMGFGKRPALLVVDVNYAFCGDKPEPILESIKRWPTSCGEEAWEGVRVIKRLIEAARAKGLPVIYTTNKKRPDMWDNGSWSWKNARQNERLRTKTNLDPNAIVDEIAPGPRDILIQKQKPSAFYATPLQSYLTLLGCDSLLVAGATTSGCVRASVLDAFSSNYRVAVVEDACFDRSQASHAVSLCDMHAKYADIVESAEVVDFISTLPAAMFDLPAGEPVMQNAASRP